MEENTLINLASIVIIGTMAQWIAMKLKLPSILFLLIFGFLAGPVFHIIHPDELLGKTLFPIISLFVAIILFEGGMDLKLKELKEIGLVLRNLISIGVLLTWAMITLSAFFILRINWPISVLIGAILVVTGPTVIGPLLRHIRPSGRVGNVVKWEGIMNDPIGVVLAILVFECLLVTDLQVAGTLVITGVLKTLFLSSSLGVLSAILLTFLLKHYWVPDVLHQVVTLMFIFITFILANELQPESGLLAVTFMGIVMANQRQVAVKHILEFKENLRVIMISILFIILAARLEINDFYSFKFSTMFFLLMVIFVIRPLSVFISCIGTDLNWKEKVFISWMAPRGIVAAAMASIFAFELSHRNIPDTEYIVPIIFIVIVTTVCFYGLTISPVARMLGFSQKNPQGILIMGAHSWARKLGKAISSVGIDVILVDTNKGNVQRAKREGLTAIFGNILSEDFEKEVDLEGIGKLLCLTANDEANSLAVLKYQDILGMANVYQVFPDTSHDEGESEIHLRGRYLFGKDEDFQRLKDKFQSKTAVKTLELTDLFTFNDFLNNNKQRDVPLFVVSPQNDLRIFALDDPPEPEIGDKLIVLSNKVRQA